MFFKSTIGGTIVLHRVFDIYSIVNTFFDIVSKKERRYTMITLKKVNKKFKDIILFENLSIKIPDRK